MNKAGQFRFLDKSGLKLSGWIDNLIEAEWKLFRLLLVLIMGDEIGKLTKKVTNFPMLII